MCNVDIKETDESVSIYKILRGGLRPGGGGGTYTRYVPPNEVVILELLLITGYPLRPGGGTYTRYVPPNEFVILELLFITGYPFSRTFLEHV